MPEEDLDKLLFLSLCSRYETFARTHDLSRADRMRYAYALFEYLHLAPGGDDIDADRIAQIRSAAEQLAAEARAEELAEQAPAAPAPGPEQAGADGEGSEVRAGAPGEPEREADEGDAAAAEAPDQEADRGDAATAEAPDQEADGGDAAAAEAPDQEADGGDAAAAEAPDQQGGEAPPVAEVEPGAATGEEEPATAATEEGGASAEEIDSIIAALVEEGAEGAEEDLFDPAAMGLTSLPVEQEPQSDDQALAGLRRFPRFVSRTEVRVSVEGRVELEQLWTQDISCGGLFVQTTEPPPLGTELSIEIDTPDGKLELLGQVVRVIEPATAAETEREAGVGVRFTDLSRERREALERYVQGLAEALETPPLEIEIDLEDDDVERALHFLHAVDATKLYESIDLPPEVDHDAIEGRLGQLGERFQGALDKVSEQEKKLLQTAIGVLERVRTVLLDGDRRLVYDFAQGHVRAEQRLAACLDEGGDPVALRAAWGRAFPDRIKESLALVEQAIAHGQAGRYDEAVAATREAVELDPFQLTLHKALERLEAYAEVAHACREAEVDVPARVAWAAERGISTDELRGIWRAIHPQRVEEAKQLGLRAREADKEGRIDDAFLAAAAALDNDPFNEQLRSAIDGWRARLAAQ